MKLVSFKKMDKQKKIAVSSIIGILLILGSILLIRSYALYEEEKEFNVLKGQIPDFGYDIKMLSVVVDGEKSTTIPSRGLYKTQVECSGGTTGEWDYNAWNLIINHAESNSKCNISFTSNLTEEEYDKYIEAGKALRRNTYRGKDITSYHNDGSLYEMISSGRFDDIYVGDYIKDENTKWLVADIDNYLYTGDTSLVKHHVTIVPSNVLMDAKINDTSTLEGGYANSGIVKQGGALDIYLNKYVTPIFSNHVLTYSVSLSTSIDDTRTSGAGQSNGGATNAVSFYNRQIDLMSEISVFGSLRFSANGNDAFSDNSQYAIFRLRPELIYTDGEGEGITYWLRAIESSTRNVCIRPADIAMPISADVSTGVRPRFLIG